MQKNMRLKQWVQEEYRQIMQVCLEMFQNEIVYAGQETCSHQFQCQIKMEEINSSFDTLKDLTVNFKDFENEGKFVHQRVEHSGVEQLVDQLLDELINGELRLVRGAATPASLQRYSQIQVDVGRVNQLVKEIFNVFRGTLENKPKLDSLQDTSDCIGAEAQERLKQLQIQKFYQNIKNVRPTMVFAQLTKYLFSKQYDPVTL